MSVLIVCGIIAMVTAIFSFVMYQTIFKEPEHVKVSTIEDDIRTIRFLKELEYWKDIKNGK